MVLGQRDWNKLVRRREYGNRLARAQEGRTPGLRLEEASSTKACSIKQGPASVVSEIMHFPSPSHTPPEDVHILILKTCEYVLCMATHL